MIKSNIQWNCKQVAKMYESGTLRFDNAIQRGIVWDIKRQSLLVDSIIKGYPTPAFYTIKLEEKIKTNKGMCSVFDCIDGKQRCNTIKKFRNNEFGLTGLDPFVDDNGNEIDLNGKTYSDLDEEMQDAFDSYSLTVYFFTDITEEEITEIMSRLNNGKPLSGVENARIKAKNLSAIIKLADHPLFKEAMTEKAINGYANEDVVIKTYMMITGDCELSSKSVKQTYEKAEFDDVTVQRLTEIFDKTCDVIKTVKTCGYKKTIKKVLSKTNLVTVINFVGNHLEESTSDLENFVIEFFDDTPESYNAACKDGTNHANKVMARNEIIANEYKNSYITLD